MSVCLFNEYSYGASLACMGHEKHENTGTEMGVKRKFNTEVKMNYCWLWTAAWTRLCQ